jgi:hypothetical protein
MELWGMLSTFAAAMEMPPFPFEALEAALCPGPFEGGVTPYGAAGDGGDGEVAAPAAANGHAAGGDGPIDPACAAAGLLLRDVHLALLRCVDGTLNKPGAKCPPQPLSARYLVRTGHGIVVSAQHWSQRAAASVHSFAAEVTDNAAPLAAAMELYQTDYSGLPFEQRAQLLRGLAELALASEALREHVAARLDAPVSALKAARPKLEPGAGGIATKPWKPPSSKSGRRDRYGEPNPDADALDNELAARGPEPSQVMAWIEWVEGQRLGLRRPLGVDIAGRRYWALGGGAGCWRIYVEGGGDGRDWGYYEGAAVGALARWLAAGGVECEAPLLRALAAMPWPLKHGAKLGPKSAAAAAAAAAGNPVVVVPPEASLMAPHEMVAARLDGYRGMSGPLVYGELNFTNGAIPPGGPARMAQGLASLLGLLPFWDWGAQEQGRLGGAARGGGGGGGGVGVGAGVGCGASGSGLLCVTSGRLCRGSGIGLSPGLQPLCLRRPRPPPLPTHPPPRRRPPPPHPTHPTPKAATELNESAECLLATESELFTAGLMDKDWAPRGWREAWRGGLAPGAPARGAMRELGSHLGALSAGAALPPQTWPRDAFMLTVEAYR